MPVERQSSPQLTRGITRFTMALAGEQGIEQGKAEEVMEQGFGVIDATLEKGGRFAFTDLAKRCSTKTRITVRDPLHLKVATNPGFRLRICLPPTLSDG